MKRHVLNEKAYSLVGVDGNAFCVMGYVAKAMRESGYSQEEIDMYYQDAKSSDYNHLLVVSIDMVEECNLKQGYKPGHQFTKPDPTSWEDERPSREDNPNYENGEDLEDDDENNEDEEDFAKFVKGLRFNESHGKFSQYKNKLFENEQMNLNVDSDILYVSHLLPLSRNQKCLYLTSEDLESLNIDIEEIKDFFEDNFYKELDIVICNNSELQVVFENTSSYEFYKIFIPDFSEEFAIDNLTNYIYTYDDMQNDINKSFVDRFTR